MFKQKEAPKRVCERCHREILPGEDFYANMDEGEDADEVFCNVCIDVVLERELDLMDTTEKAEMLHFGLYIDAPGNPEPEQPIPGQIDMFGRITVDDVDKFTTTQNS